MIVFLLLVAYGLVWVAPPIVHLSRRGHGRIRGLREHDVQLPKALQILKFFVTAQAALMSASAVTSYISGGQVEVVVAAVLVLLSLAVLGSFWLHDSTILSRCRTFVSAVTFVTWPAVLFAMEPTWPRLLGILIAHGLGAFVMDILCCPPVFALLLTSGSVAVPAVFCWSWDPGDLNALVEVTIILVLPIMFLVGSACHYVRCIRRELQSTDADRCEVRDDLSDVLSTIMMIKDGMADETLDDLLEAMPALRVPVPDPLFHSNEPLRRPVRHTNPFNMAALLSAVVEDTKNMATGVVVLLSTAISETDMLVGSEYRIRRALTIAMQNAVRSNRTGSVLLSAESSISTSTGPSSPRLRLCVQEIGAALPQQYLEQLVRFISSDAPDMAAGQEPLRLWICNRMVSAMGGKMEIASMKTGPNPGFGVIFDLSLEYWLDPDLTEKLDHLDSLDPPSIFAGEPVREHSIFSFSQSRSWGSVELPMRDSRHPSKELLSQLLAEAEKISRCGSPVAEQTSLAHLGRYVVSPKEAHTEASTSTRHPMEERRSLSPGEDAVPLPRSSAAGDASSLPGSPMLGHTPRLRALTAKLPPFPGLEPAEHAPCASTSGGPSRQSEGMPSGSALPGNLLEPDAPRLSTSAFKSVAERNEGLPAIFAESGDAETRRKSAQPVGPPQSLLGPDGGTDATTAAGNPRPLPPSSSLDSNQQTTSDHPCNSQISLAPSDDSTNPLQPKRSSRSKSRLLSKSVSGSALRRLLRDRALSGPRHRHPPSSETPVDHICHSQSMPVGMTALPPLAPNPIAVLSTGTQEDHIKFLSKHQFGLLFISRDLASLREMANVCKSLGICVRCAVSGKSAEAIFQRHPDIEVVIMDQGDQLLVQRMELAQCLRQQAHGRRLVIFSLVLVLNGKLLRLLSDFPVGLVDHYFSKPLSVAKLLTELQHFLSDPQASDAPAMEWAHITPPAVLDPPSPVKE